MGAWCKFVAFHICVHPTPSVITATIGMKWLTYISLQHIWHIPLHPSLMCFGIGGWAGPTHIPFQHTLQLHLTCGNFYLNSLMCLMWVEMWRKFEHMDTSIPSSTTYSISIWHVAIFCSICGAGGESSLSCRWSLVVFFTLHWYGNMLVLEEDGREIDYTNFLTRNRMEEAF